MSKAVSYYDWELQFRKKIKPPLFETKRRINTEVVNSLGVNDSEYKDFMKKWKEKNF